MCCAYDYPSCEVMFWKSRQTVKSLPRSSLLPATLHTGATRLDWNGVEQPSSALVRLSHSFGKTFNFPDNLCAIKLGTLHSTSSKYFKACNRMFVRVNHYRWPTETFLNSLLCKPVVADSSVGSPRQWTDLHWRDNKDSSQNPGRSSADMKYMKPHGGEQDCSQILVSFKSPVRPSI